MPYIGPDGTVVQERSWMRLSIVSDAFWGVLNLVMVFFQTLISDDTAQQYVGKKKSGGGGGGGSAPRGGPGGPGGPRRGGFGGARFDTNVPMAGG